MSALNLPIVNAWFGTSNWERGAMVVWRLVVGVVSFTVTMRLAERISSVSSRPMMMTFSSMEREAGGISLPNLTMVVVSLVVI